MNLSNILIILSRPSEAGNIGAVCRSMKNMGLSKLRLISPSIENPHTALCEAGFSFGGNEAVIRARAIHATEIWEQAETFDTLKDAVSDCSFVVGVTRRRGRHRKQATMNPIETAAFLKNFPGQCALVFGNERTGLEDEELELCNMASHIPSNENFPSLNLSHAVMIYAYELFKAFNSTKEETVKGQWVPLNQKNINALVYEIMENLKSLGFYKQQGREEQERFFRDVFSRAALTEREGNYFSGIIEKAARLAKKADPGKANSGVKLI